MSNLSYIEKLKEKCNLNDEFVEKINSLFNSLFNFGYISNSSIKKLSKRLYDNIDVIVFGKDNYIDYKSGYYDAIKKEMYIKDPKNTESVFLHLIYAMTTLKYENNTMSVGYSTSNAVAPDYIVKYKNYGINRAIVSNLVCRLLYTLPETLTLIPSYRTYENNFLGYKIEASNDIYFVEGKILSQICNALNIDEENIYYHIFLNNPVKYLKKVFINSRISNPDKLLEDIDNMSKSYSNYNKLCYLEKTLNDNYINIKKHILNDNIEEFKKKDKKIKLAIKDTLYKLDESNATNNDEEFLDNVESSLTEKINLLEEHILKQISKIQNVLVDNILNKKNLYLPIEYVSKLKKLESILVIKNEKLSLAIYNTIYNELLVESETTSINLIEKIKYSIINEVLSNNKFTKARNSISFKIIHDINDDEQNNKYIALNLDKTFVELVKVTDLNKPMKALKNNTNIIQINNLKHLLNTNTITIITDEIENICTSIKNEYEQFKYTELENMYICGIENFRLLIIMRNNNIDVIKLENKGGKLVSTLLNLSSNYNVFNSQSINTSNKNTKNLPMIYKKKKNIFERLLSIF